MIKKLNIEDITKILKIDDPDFEKFFPCEIGEWVQFLIKNADNPNVFIWGSFSENGMLNGYVVASSSDSILSKKVFVLYLKTMGYENNKEVLGIMKEWGKEKKLRTIEFITVQPEVLAKYGFSKKAAMMGMEI